MPNHIHPKYGWGWRTKNRRLQKYVKIELNQAVYGTPAETFARITDTIERAGLVDAHIEMDIERGQWEDRDRDVLVAAGWRDATSAEKADAEEQYAQRQARIAAHEQDEVAKAEALLRERRPDLFTS